MTPSNIDENIKSGYWIVYFWVENRYSYKLIPIIESLSEEINTVKFGEISSEFSKFDVRGTPTVILFKDGKEIDRKVGSNYSKEELKEWIILNIK